MADPPLDCRSLRHQLGQACPARWPGWVASWSGRFLWWLSTVAASWAGVTPS